MLLACAVCQGLAAIRSNARSALTADRLAVTTHSDDEALPGLIGALRSSHESSRLSRCRRYPPRGCSRTPYRSPYRRTCAHRSEELPVGQDGVTTFRTWGAP